MEIDTIRSTNIRSSFQNNSSNSPPPSPTPIELSLQQWLVFSPQQDSVPDPNADPDRSQSPITLPSMPSHDGRGHFFNSNATSSSSSSQSSEHHFSYVNYSPTMSSSLISLSELESEDDERLSIPSSISADPSVSRRSSDSSSNYQQPNSNQSNYPVTAPDTQLLLSPMAISAGLIEPNQTILNKSNLSSHHSNEDSVVNKRRNNPTDSSKRNPSRSSLASRMNKPPSLPISSCSYQHTSQPPIPPSPSTTILPNQHYIHEQKNHSPQMLNFLSNVAYKLLDIHPDTIHLFSSSNHLQHHDQQLNLRSNNSNTYNKHNNKFRAKRFMIGDGDSDRMRIEENQDDEIQSPLDLSGFKPRISSQYDFDQQVSSSSSSSEEEEQRGRGRRFKSFYRTDSCETFRPKYDENEEEKVFKRSLSDHQLNSSSSSTTILKPNNLDFHHPHHLNRSFSSDHNLDHLHLHSNMITSTPSSSSSSSSTSITGLLFRKVWHEWINWEL